MADDKLVQSPASSGVRVRSHPGPGSGQSLPLSPGARSNPTARSRGDQAGEPPQPPGPPASAGDDARGRRKSERGAELRVTAPEE
jgi:hypothetical protein